MLLLEGITKKYENLTVFEEMDLDIAENRVTCILGPSGCGKTTLLRIIAGIEELDKGRRILDNNKVSYVFQEPRLLPWGTLRANLEFVSAKKEIKKIDYYLEMMELKQYSSAYPKELSGGMKQRVSIIRAFVYPHDILLMDEPFQALDLKLKTKLLKEVYTLHKDMNNTIISVTHDLDEALYLGDEIIVLSKKPAVISKRFKIDISREERNFNNQEIQALKSKIIRLLDHTPI